MVFLGRWRGRPVAVKLIAWDGPGGGTGGVGPVERAVYREIENVIAQIEKRYMETAVKVKEKNLEVK